MTRFGLVSLLVGLCAAPSAAQDIVSFGGTGCVMWPTPDASHVAEVICSNVQTSGNNYDEGVMTVGGLAVGLAVLHGPGDIPDRFTLAPPLGYIAVPDVLVLDENTTDVALIFEWAGV